MMYTVYSRLETPKYGVDFVNVDDAKAYLQTKDKNYILVSYQKGNFSRTAKEIVVR